MSFSLLTALDISDIPVILRRCAQNYRGTQTKLYPITWKLVADEIEIFADNLKLKIDEWKAAEPKPKHRREFL